MYSLTSILLKSNPFRVHNAFNAVRSIKMRIRPYRRIYETLDQKSMRRKLPTSPCLSIYKPQITTIISITHRIAGVFLGCCNFMFALNAIFNPHDYNHIITMIKGLELSNTSLLLMRIMLVYPMSYHVCTGLRHLVWAYGKCLTMKEVYMTGYVCVTSSFLLATTLAML